MDLLNLTEEEMEDLQKLEDACPPGPLAGRRSWFAAEVAARLNAPEKKPSADHPVQEEQEAQAG